jgi:hypothetical protein
MIMKMKRKLAMFLLCGLLALTPLFADDSLFGEADLFGDDDLFGGSDLLVEDVSETSLALDKLLLENPDGVVIGGNFSFSLTPGWVWDVGSQDNKGTMSTNLNTQLFFDARPNTNIRVFGKAVVSYPFAVTETPNRTFSDIFSIKELFSDFAIEDSLFFRVGKQTLNWGVGYFFSPADLLNLSEINPADPTADLEGPVSVKVNMPLGVDNLYGYVIIPDGTTDVTELAVAAKYEKVFKTTELGFGAYYRQSQAPAAMVTFSTGIGDVAVFGEGMISYGSDRSFKVGNPLLPTVVENPDDRLYLSGTLGARFSWTDRESDLGVSFAGQYFYNGEGYTGDDLISLPMDNARQHYAAANISVSLSKTLSTGLFWYGGMSDLSGLINPSITWSPKDYFSVSLGLSTNYGELGDEFVPILFGNRKLSATLGFTLGGTGF